ncbi:MAG: STAS domain-containing protein [Fuerstiella sp.]|jgi:anti-anti-sigma factor|nr:STAS domain-containing protein [Fuerstiella sp.]
MEIVKNSSGDLLEMQLSGSFDNESSVHFRESIEESARAGWHRILVDLGNVDYISSAGLGALVAARKNILTLNGQFGVHNPSAFVAKVLMLTKLHDMLIVAPSDFHEFETQATTTLDVSSQRSARVGSVEMEIFSVPSTEPMKCSIFGDAKALQNSSTSKSTSHGVSFGYDSYGLGLGALASQSASGENQYGELVAVSGTVSQSAPTSSQLPDYSIVRGEFTPTAHFLYGAKMEGHFSSLIRFNHSDPEARITVSELVQCCMQEQGIRTAACVILADCAGLLGAQMKHWNIADSGESAFSVPRIRDWLSYCPEHFHQHKLALIVGVATLDHATMPSALQSFLRPLSGNSQQTGHFHAAVFPYRALKKRTIDLQSFVHDLFEESEIQEVLHLLRDVRPTTGETESELQSGACWIEPIDPSRITEVSA